MNSVLYVNLFDDLESYSYKFLNFICLVLIMLQVVALVCNFSGSCNPSSVRLNHWELETLFHEFGHALHSLLSRTVFCFYLFANGAFCYYLDTNNYISLGSLS